MDAEKRKQLVQLIEEDIQILSESLGHFSRISIYNPIRKEGIEHTKKDIEFMLNLRKKYSE